MYRFVIAIIFFLVHTNCFGQAKPNLDGTWILSKTVIDGKEVMKEEIGKDTITFLASRFEERIVLKDNGIDFLWIQRGDYEQQGKTLILKNRVTSTGDPNVKYPEISLRYRIKHGTLILELKVRKDERLRGNSKGFRYFNKIV